jgi:glyoxylase-like metal-dependent hydrolase (beta-lactamase superfamily II)
MTCLRYAAAAAAALSCAVAASAQPDLSAVEISSVDLGDGLHMLVGAGGNIGVSVGPDGVVMVDDQFAPLSDRIAAKIEELGGGPVRFVLNTHHHGDHTGGNENFTARGATVVAHDNVRTRLMSPSTSPTGAVNPPRPAEAWPVVTFADSVTFHMNGQTVHAIHVANAHTDGDTIVWFEEADVIHMGDTLNWNSYPRIDGNANGSLDGFIAAAETALSHADGDTRVVPGHGSTTPLGRADLEAYRDMLTAARDILAPAAANPESIDELLAADPLASLNGRWGGGSVTPEAFIRSVVAPPPPQ